MHTFPFENLNPFLSLPVFLDKDSLFQKFVLDKRGGYCFEQNLLFMYVLQALGYEVRGVLGNVFHQEKISERRTHMLLLVSLDELKYLVDVGFGSIASDTPLLLKTGIEQPAQKGVYRILPFDEDEYILQSEWGANWKSLYAFALQIQHVADFEVANWFTSTNPKAQFMDSIQLSFKSENDRYTLENNKFTTYLDDGKKDIRILNSVDEILDVIQYVFLINLDNLPQLNRRLISIL